MKYILRRAATVALFGIVATAVLAAAPGQVMWLTGPKQEQTTS
ncbi:hypothetical protein OG422_07960 [Streptomyces sp. NBC_01525]|nr:hypothetical protein [Streptomyces benahoarensis]